MIRAVQVPARRLLTLREDDPAWSDPDLFFGSLTREETTPSLDGALVRLHPPPSASEQDVAGVVSRLERCGVVRVKVVPRTQTPEVVRRIDVDPSSVPKLSHREAVLAAAAEARSSDPAALRGLLEGILDEEGI